MAVVELIGADSMSAPNQLLIRMALAIVHPCNPLMAPDNANRLLETAEYPGPPKAAVDAKYDSRFQF